MYILTGRYKWNKTLTAILLMLLSFLVILVPIALLINMMSSKINFALDHSSQVLSSVQQLIHSYEKRYNMELVSAKNIQDLSAWGAQTLPRVLGATFNSIITIIIMYFILYFMLVNGRKTEGNLIEWMPLKNENVLLLRRETNSLVFSNAIGIPLIALFQGFLGLASYLALGVPEPMFWFAVPVSPP